MDGSASRSLGISLRPVSRHVGGRENHRGRVTYLCEDNRRRTPERVILWRWRQCGFGGYRLRPNIWRVLGEMPALRGRLTVEQIATILERKRQQGGEIAKLLPPGARTRPIGRPFCQNAWPLSSRAMPKGPR